MLASFPLAWFLLALPFISAAIIAQVKPLRRLAAEYNRITWRVGVCSLVLLLVGLMADTSAAWSLPLIVLAGLGAGFAVFRSRPEGEDDDDDDDGRWRRPPPDDRPPDPIGGGPDWELFDRLRRRWERPRVPQRR